MAAFKHTLGIDPGLGGTGWAIIQTQSDLGMFLGMDSDGVILPARKLHGFPWDVRSYDVAKQFEGVLEGFGRVCGVADEVVIEVPSFWTGSAVGNAAAKSGDLIALAALVGMLIFQCHAAGLKVHHHTPQGWKGQLTKDAVAARVNRSFVKHGLDPVPYKNHANDALGIALYQRGMF